MEATTKTKRVPKPPLTRVLREGVFKKCLICHSTMPRNGLFLFVGKRYCDNKNCVNSKQ